MYVGMDNKSIIDIDEECQFFIPATCSNVDSLEFLSKPKVALKLCTAGYSFVVHFLHTNTYM